MPQETEIREYTDGNQASIVCYDESILDLLVQGYRDDILRGPALPINRIQPTKQNSIEALLQQLYLEVMASGVS